MDTAPSTCESCGVPLGGDAQFCPSCGAPVAGYPGEPGPPPIEPTVRQPRLQTAPPAGRPPAARPRYPTVAARRRFSSRTLAAAAVALVLLIGAAAGALVALGRGSDEPPAPSGSPAAGIAPASGGPATATAALTVPPTPADTPSPAATPSPGPSASPTPRIVNGLQVVDEQFVGRVVEAGGLRIRSAPRVEPGNVVGSVPQGAEINVAGRVLNGQEAEPGKGTVWLIVGPNQYLYAGPGYVERLR